MRQLLFATALSLLASNFLFSQDGPYRPEIKNRQVKNIKMFLPFHDQLSKVCLEDVNGIAILEGDIILGPVEKLERNNVVAIDGSSYRWEGGRIPFVITNGFTEDEIGNINQAIQMLNTKTNLFLFPRTHEGNYISFARRHTEHSASPVGRQKDGQTIELGDNMRTVGVIVHEILHSAGLFHEQSREDRDTYVEIIWENIEPGQAHNFCKETGHSTDIGSYNYCSIMQYGQHSFGKKVNGEPLQTMRCKMACDCIKDHSNRDSITTSDIAGVNSIYPSKYSIPWIQQPGSDGRDVAVNENGIVFMTNSNGYVYKFNGERWIQLPGSDAVNIASNAQKTCMVNSAGKIYRFINGAWTQMPGSDGTDIAINSDGSIWLVNSAGKIYKFDGTKWNQLPGSDGKRISASGGQVWLVNSTGKVYKFDDTKWAWKQMPGSNAIDIAVSNDGSIWLTNSIGFIYKWNGAAWSQVYGSDGKRIAVNKNKAFLVNTAGKIYELEY